MKNIIKKWWFYVGLVVLLIILAFFNIFIIKNKILKFINNKPSTISVSNYNKNNETEEEKEAREKKEQEEREEEERKAKEEEEEKTRIEKEKKENEEKEFKESCKKYTFKELARNPDEIKGKNVKLTGEVVQVIYGDYITSLRVDITKTGKYSTYYEDTIYVYYEAEEKEDRILEDDIITIWGTSGGDFTYTSTMGAPITLPLVYAKYINIDK